MCLHVRMLRILLFSCIIHVGSHRGVPNELMRGNNHAVPIAPHLIPDPDTAVQSASGGHLTMFSPFGQDPLRDRADLVSQTESNFLRRYPDYEQFFYTAVNGDFSIFCEGLLHLIDLSKHIESQI